jgi:hypothetical protein
VQNCKHCFIISPTKIFIAIGWVSLLKYLTFLLNVQALLYQQGVGNVDVHMKKVTSTTTVYGDIPTVNSILRRVADEYDLPQAKIDVGNLTAQDCLKVLGLIFRMKDNCFLVLPDVLMKGYYVLELFSKKFVINKRFSLNSSFVISATNPLMYFWIATCLSVIQRVTRSSVIEGTPAIGHSNSLSEVCPFNISMNASIQYLHHLKSCKLFFIGRI